MSIIKEDDNFEQQMHNPYLEKTRELLKQKLQMRRTQNILRNKILSNTTPIQKNQTNKLSIPSRIFELVRKRSKSWLTFHEYKGPLQKVEVTKVPLKLTSNENQLRQQELFLELIHNQGNYIDQSIETMKLADLKTLCKNLNISSTGTKIKLIEKIKNARNQQQMSENQSINNEVLNDNLYSNTSHMDWMTTSDFTQYLNQFDFETTSQQQNTYSFDIFSPSSQMN